MILHLNTCFAMFYIVCEQGVTMCVFVIIVQVSEAGIHRPHVAGIAGRAQEGAYSIVLSGGYEDDKVMRNSA